MNISKTSWWLNIKPNNHFAFSRLNSGLLFLYDLQHEQAVVGIALNLECPLLTRISFVCAVEPLLDS